jgi:hypothetical protein
VLLAQRRDDAVDTQAPPGGEVDGEHSDAATRNQQRGQWIVGLNLASVGSKPTGSESRIATC